MGFVRIGLLGVALLGLWTAGSSLYIGFHDDLIASLMTREASMQYAYEDRIAALRVQVDRESSLRMVTQASLDGKIRDLTRRAASLETRESLVTQLADRAGIGRSHGSPVARVPSLAATVGATAVDDPGNEGQTTLAPGKEHTSPTLPSWRDKPHPEAETDAAARGAHASRDDPSSIRLQVAELTATLERIDAAQYRVVSSIGETAHKKVEAFRNAVVDLGLPPDRFISNATQAGVGGPFVPLDNDVMTSPFGHALTTWQADVAAAEHLRTVLPKLPFASPLLGNAEVTSPFGARLDPFLGRPAMHTGVDLREGYGTEVRATAEGRVVSAGSDGGYGTMIEVDHGSGLSTRYAHLSSMRVSPGQTVGKGDVIGEVGASGRATGPHLHYETRIDGEPVDPMRLLEAGQRLAAVSPSP